MGGARRGNRVIGALAVASLALAGCSTGDDDPAEGDGRIAAVYGATLEWMIAEEADVGRDERPDWVLFVATRSEEPIGIDVQAAVIELLDERVVVRFVDDRAEAVAEDVDGQPVRDDGMLVGLGAVPPDGDRVEVYADRYRDADDVRAWEFTVQRSGDSWDIVGDPLPSEVRPLPGG